MLGLMLGPSNLVAWRFGAGSMLFLPELGLGTGGIGIGIGVCTGGTGGIGIRYFSSIWYFSSSEYRYHRNKKHRRYHRYLYDIFTDTDTDTYHQYRIPALPTPMLRMY